METPRRTEWIASIKTCCWQELYWRMDLFDSCGIAPLSVAVHLS